MGTNVSMLDLAGSAVIGEYDGSRGGIDVAVQGMSEIIIQSPFRGLIAS